MAPSSKAARRPSGQRPASRPKAAKPPARELKNSVQSLAKGFRILESFSAGQEEMTLSEIADTANLDPGTTFRMLNTLVDLGYVARLPDSRRFALTLKVLDLGFHAIARKDLRALVRPILRSLVDETSEAASFGVLVGADILYIERVRAGFTRLGVDIRIGTTIPASASVIGQALLAFLPRHALEQALAAHSPQAKLVVSPPARARLQPLLDQIRTRGYVLEDSVISEGLRILAVPVLDADGYAIGAISIAAPRSRSSVDGLRERALEPVRNAARAIARALEATGSTSFSS